MSLLDLARETKNNFDPAKDKVNGNDALPAGTYDAIISNVEFVNYDSGWENIVVTADIATGQFAKRKERISFSFIEEWKGKPISAFILSRNMKLAQKLGFIGDYEFKESDFQDTYALAQALKNVIGAQLILTIKEMPNKDKPDSPYRNYEVDAYPVADPNSALPDPAFPNDDDEPAF